MSAIDRPDLVYLVPWLGVVVDNADPEGLHRVRIRVDGLIEPSTDWAYPLTAGGGSAQRGAHAVPAIGASVIVQFLGGDSERPIYQTAWWKLPSAGSEMPTDAAAAGSEAHHVQVLELEGIAITVDERNGKRVLAIYDRELREKAKADPQLAALGVGEPVIEYDIEGKGLTLSGLSAVLIKSRGLISIDGLEVHIAGRVVLESGKAI